MAGRFGGDEFLFVNLRDIDYQACKAFMTEIYEGKVLRRNVPLEDCHPFVTGTVGCAMMAGVASGAYRDLGEAKTAMVKKAGTYEPDTISHGRYAEVFARYERLYPAIRPLV